ncbi:MAG: nuclear transport factor 2 family protein [Ignavibacteria bacterium]|nr:nuclear transport factor 2 family protein [Ignavibacteria bacterium]
MAVRARKHIALNFLTLSAKGESRKAFGLYVGQGFKHHNAYYKGDAESLMTAMEENAKANPEKVFDSKCVVEDGDLVAVHSHIKQTPVDLGDAVVHIFRFEGDKIVELWDLGQTVPADSVNENGMF